MRQLRGYDPISGAEAAEQMQDPTDGASARIRRRRRLLLGGVAASAVALAVLLPLAARIDVGGSGRLSLSSKKHHHTSSDGSRVSELGVAGPPERYQTSAVTGERLSRSFTTSAGVLRDCMVPDCSDPTDMEGNCGGYVVVDTSAARQKIIGFGAAFTDAAAENYYKLPEAARDRFMNALFGPAGIGYTLGRIPMNSCDFGRDHYSFDDVAGDYELRHFDSHVRHDRIEKLPMLMEALSRDPALKLFISPWSPPAWMKTPVNGNQSMIQSSWPHGLLDDPKVKRTWAKYFSKFIDAYATAGISIWGLTIQNEPENPGPWEACVYDAAYMRDFVRDYLGPEIRRRHKNVKIMAYDHNKDHLAEWTRTIFSDKTAAQYVDGMAYHWYFGGLDRGLDGAYGWSQLGESLDLMPPGKFLLSSESCNCPKVDHTFWGSWARAEKMGHDILAGLAGGSGGWVDWNVLLDYYGGPNWVGNLCDTPVYCNEDFTDVVFSPMYYYMGHFSRFMPPDSTVLRVAVAANFTAGGARPSGVLIGYEASSYRCEGSARQTWKHRADGKLEMVDMMTEGFEFWSPVCLARRVTPHTFAVSMVVCDSIEAGIYIFTEDGSLQLDEEASFPPTPAPTPAPTMAVETPAPTVPEPTPAPTMVEEPPTPTPTSAAVEPEPEPTPSPSMEPSSPAPTPAPSAEESVEPTPEPTPAPSPALTPAPSDETAAFEPSPPRPPGAPELPYPGEGAPPVPGAEAANDWWTPGPNNTWWAPPTPAPAAATEPEDDAGGEAEAGGDPAARRRQLLANAEKEQCLSIAGGSSEDGPILTLLPCAGKHWQQWEMEGGAITSRLNGNCITAGWPYLTAVAAKTPEGRISVVVHNEAGEDASFGLLFPVEGKKLDGSIPAHSVQTYVI